MSRQTRVVAELVAVWLAVTGACAVLLAWTGASVPSLVALEVGVLAYLIAWLPGKLDHLCLADGTPLPGLGLPNLLSTARLVCVPAAAAGVLTMPGEAPAAHRWALVALLFLMVLSDTLDGVLARRLGLQTRFGEILDPSADFLLHLLLSLALFARGLVPTWFAAIVFGRVALLLLGGYLLVRQGAVDRSQLEAMKLGKPAVAAVGIAMVLALLAWAADTGLATVPWLCAVAAALALASLGEKALFYIRTRR